MQPLVSIIMGVYNERHCLRRCIDSIVNQTYENWEFIICDDCSTDNSGEILNEYSSADSRIVIIRNKKNSRLAQSLNNCLKVAKGKYIARMDADDVSLSNRLSTQVDFLLQHPQIDCVGSSRIMFDENGDRGIRAEVESPAKNIMLYRTPFAHPTIMIKKEVLEELGGYSVRPETMRAEDLDLWIRFFEKGFIGYNIQKPLYKYHESENDLKKRTLKAAVGISKVYVRGYKKLGFPKYQYFFALKPIVAALIPKKIMARYYRKKEF